MSGGTKANSTAWVRGSTKQTVGGGIVLDSTAWVRGSTKQLVGGGIVLDTTAWVRETKTKTVGGGIKVSGKARITMIDSARSCYCGWQGENKYDEEMSGGVTLGVAARVTDNLIYGGLAGSGTAIVSVLTQALEEYIFVYPLDETSGPTYIDHGPRGLDGSGTATVDDGIFCSASQHFDGQLEYITLPYDNYGGPFTVTAWVKLEDIFYSRLWYTRGHSTQSDKWQFCQGHSFVNHLLGRVQNTDSTAMEAYSSTMMDADKWYHCATSWDGSAFRQHIDGIDEGTTDGTGEAVRATNGGYIGRYEGSQPFRGNLQELRLYAGIRSTAHLKAEFDNWCNAEFYHVSKKILPTW
jgi:hypothetical protein